jgi:hypothetical protein
MKAAKKKKLNEPKHQTTATSSPLRGQNQDQSGIGVKHDVADYTISDERKMKIKEIVNEVVAGVGAVRSKPVNMGQSTGSSKEPNAPSNAAKLQSAANQRVNQLDKAAQQQKDQQQKQADQQKKQREADALKRVKAQAPKPAQPPVKNQMKEETMRFKDFAKLDLDEARIQFGSGKAGRKKASGTEDDPGSEHVMMQMRKVISTRGEHKVQHVSGEKSTVHPTTAHKILQHHDNLRTPAEKQAYAARIHKSKESMGHALAGKPEEKRPKVSLAGKITGTQK